LIVYFSYFQTIPFCVYRPAIESKGLLSHTHSGNAVSTMSAEFCWTRTADHVRLSEIASRQSSCLAASFNQLQLVDPWANPVTLAPSSSSQQQHRSSGLLIWTGQPQADDATTTTTYDYRSLAMHINSWLENLPTVSKFQLLYSMTMELLETLSLGFQVEPILGGGEDRRDSAGRFAGR
jgi:hypothetical protein